MPVVAELRNVIIGDDTSWRAAVLRTQESLAALQAQSQQMTASLATAFAGASAPLGATAASFQALGNEAQAAATVITNSGQAAAVAAQNVASLGASAVQAGSGVAELALRKAQLAAELSNVNGAIRAETRVLADAQGAVQNLGTGHVALNSAVKESEANLAGYILRQAALKTELGAVNAAINGTTGAHRVAAPALLATGAATGEVGAKTSILNALFTAQTTQISSQRTIWQGYDNVIQAVIRTMGGIPVIWALAITIGGILLQQLLSMGKAKKELGTITADLINSDLALANIFAMLQTAAGGTNEVLNNQAALYDKLAHSTDFSALLTSFATHYDELIPKINLVKQAEEEANATRQTASSLVRNLTSDNDRAAATAAIYASAAKSAARAEDEANIKRGEAEALIRKDVATIADFINATNRSTESIYNEIAASKKLSEDALANLQARLIEATNAQEQLNAASRAYRPPKLDSTIATYDQLRAAINKNADDLEKAGKSQGEILVTLKPQLEAYKKATIEKIAAEQTGISVTLNNATAQKILGNELKTGGDKTAEYAGKVPLLDRNIKALSSTTDAHAKSAGVARSAVSQYAEGVLGLGKAFDTVAGSLAAGTFSKLFDDLPKKARQGLDGLKQAAQSIVKELDDLLKHATAEGFKFAFSDKDLKPTIASLQALGATGVMQFKGLSEAAKVVQEELTKFKLAAINLKQPIFEVPYAVMRDGFGNITAAGERIIAVVQKIGGIIKEVLPGVGTVITQAMIDSVNAASTATGEIEAMGKSWLVSLGQIKAGVPPAADAIGRLRQAIHDMREDIAADPLFNALRMTEEAARAYDDVINLTRTKGELLGLTQNETNELILHNLDVFGARFGEKWGISADQAIAVFKRQMDKLPGALDEIFNKLFLGAKHAVSGIFDVIANIPGKIGDTLRKGTDGFTKWVNQIDGILKGLHKIFNQIPDGLAPILQKVVGIFKKTSQDVQGTMRGTEEDVMNSTGSIAQAAEKNIGGGVSKAFAVGAMAAAGFATALEVAANASSKAMGFIQATITSALSGIVAALSTGNPIIGAIVGGVSLIGGIIGLFRGKSAAQKASEQAQLDKLKADIAATVQSTVNAAIDGMKSALELFEKLADFTVIPQKTIHRFFNHLELVLQEFVELSKVFSGGMLDAAKALAEKIGPIVDVIGNAVGAFEALGGFTGIAQVSVDAFSSAMTRVLQSFIAIKDKFLDAEGFINSTVNQARKFAEKIGGVILVIKDALDAFSGFQTFKNVLPETLDAFAATLQLAINKMGAIAEAVDKVMIKTAQRFSDRAVSVVALIKTALDAFVPLATFAAIPAEAMDALFAGISDAVSRMQELAAALDTEMLTRAVAVAEKSAAIFNAIKGGVDALTSLADFKAVAPEAFQALLDGFNQAVSILNSMLEKATQFEAIAIQIESKLTSAAKHLKDGATTIAAALASAAAATSGTSGGGSASVASLSAGPSGTGFGIGAPSSPFAPSGGGSTVVETYHVNVTVQGSMLGTKAELQDVVVGAITQAQRRGRAAA